MRYLVQLALILQFISVSSASDMTDALCEKEGTRFGNGTGKDRIPEECLFHISTKTNAYTYRKSADQDFTVWGHKNIISIKDPKTKMKSQNVISGKYTELEEVTAIALDEVNKEIVVINQGREVLSYSSVITGNVAPLRSVKSQDLEGAVDLVINPKKDQLIVLNPSTRQILFYSRLANSAALEGKKKLEVVKRIGKVDGEHLALNVEKQELYVISLERGVILAWNLEDFSVRKVTFEKPHLRIKSIELNSHEEKIYLETEKSYIKISVGNSQ
jgi:hypothetical protein